VFSLLLAGSTACLAGHHRPVERETSIGFANRSGLENWPTHGDTTTCHLRHWQAAELFGQAFDLPHGEDSRMGMRPSGRFGTFGAIMVPGHCYGLRSFERVDGRRRRSGRSDLDLTRIKN
jgi:hypothetical protein